MQNFASGLFGALVGGLVTLVATYFTLRNQRRLAEEERQTAAEERLAQRELAAEDRAAQRALATEERAAQRERERDMTTRAAAVELLQHMITVLRALDVFDHMDIPDLGSLMSDSARVKARRAEVAFDAIQRTNLLVLPRLLEPRLRSRAGEWILLCESLRDFAWTQTHDEASHRRRDVSGYMAYLHGTIDAYLGDRPLPPDADPPSLINTTGDPWQAPGGSGYAAPL